MAAAKTPANRVRAFIKEPFTKRNLQRFVFAIMAFPAGLARLILLLAQRRTVAGVILLKISALIESRNKGSNTSHGNTILSSLGQTICGAIILPITIYILAGVALNIGYPLRGMHTYKTDWGGPTFVGAYALHGIVGTLLFIFAGTQIIQLLVWTQRKLY